jgi:hypothetical protein
MQPPTPEEKNEIIARFNGGETMADIAASMGRSHYSVLGIIQYARRKNPGLVISKYKYPGTGKRLSPLEAALGTVHKEFATLDRQAADIAARMAQLQRKISAVEKIVR